MPDNEETAAPIDAFRTTQRAEGVTAKDRTAHERQFDRIMADYGAALARLAASYEKFEAQREELAQEIALAIWQALPHFRGECSERTFIYRIAHNRSLSHVWKRTPVHEDLQELEESRQPVDPEPHPEELAAQSKERARLMAAIQSLPLNHRQVILLLLEDLSHAEIAEVLGISENNAGVRLNRARKALKEIMGAKS